MKMQRRQFVRGVGAAGLLSIAGARVVHAATIKPDAKSALLVHDLGSTNGTHVGGHALVAEHLLRVGDELRVGETELRYEE